MQSIRNYQIFILGLFLCLTASCVKDNYPSCIDDSIKQLKSTDWKGHISQFNYQDEPVYYVVIDETCCDQANILYDSNCNVICISGGWAGSHCPDSGMNALTNERILFENN